MRSVFIFTICLSAFLFTFIVYGGKIITEKKESFDKAPVSNEKFQLVKTFISYKGILKNPSTYPAKIVSDTETNISSRVNARILRINVDEGTSAPKNSILIELDSYETDYAIELIQIQKKQTSFEINALNESLKALLETERFWKKELKRTISLKNKGVVSESTGDTAKEKVSNYEGLVKSTKQKLNSLKANIEALDKRNEELLSKKEEYLIKAPYDGIISQITCTTGEIALPGKNLLKIETTNSLKVVFDVSINDYKTLKINDQIIFNVSGITDEAFINRIFPTAKSDETIRIEAIIPNKSLHLAGNFAEVYLKSNKNNETTIIPVESIFRDKNGNTFVYTVKNNRTIKNEINVISYSETLAGISGILPEQEVILIGISGNMYINENIRTEIIK